MSDVTDLINSARQAMECKDEIILRLRAENGKLRELLAEGHAALSWMLLEGMDVCIPETCPVEYKSVANAAGAIADAIGVSE